MSAKALKYAEDTLGVHEVFEATDKLTVDLDAKLGELDKAQDTKRLLADEYADREVELISEMRGVHSSMSDTRFKSEFKRWEWTDEKLREIRSKQAEVLADIQGLEYDLEVVRTRIKVGTARMVELGGYLQYLAVIKNAARDKELGKFVSDFWMQQNQAETTDKTTGDKKA
jgi:hypothetical protein